MKRILFIGLTTALISFANTSQANFSFHSSVPNACEYVAGQWTGSGKATNWFIGECIYHGSGSSSTLDPAGNFTIQVSADKDSGSILCPSHAEKQLSGVCQNGAVTIMTEYGNMTGGFTKNTGEAKGTLSVGPGMNAEVTLQFQRVG